MLNNLYLSRGWEERTRTAFLVYERNPNCIVNYRYMFDMAIKFSETGSVKNKKRSNTRVPNKGFQIKMLRTAAAEFTSSLRSVVERRDIKKSTENTLLSPISDGDYSRAP